MSNNNQNSKAQFNIKELLDSETYKQKLALIQSEINSNSIKPIIWDRDTKDKIKAVKKAYNKLKRDPELLEIGRKELITAVVEASKKQLKSNFVLTT